MGRSRDNWAVTDDIKLVVGSNIRRLREKRGWSQKKLAEMADLDRTYVGRIERGERRSGVPLTDWPFPGIILLWHCPWRILSGITEAAAGSPHLPMACACGP